MSNFELHTEESAPEGSREFLAAAREKFGFLPNVLAVQSESTALVKGYMTLSGIFGESSFTPGEQQIILLSASMANGCRYCAAAHTGGAMGQQVDGAVIEAIRSGTEISDPRMAALNKFTVQMANSRGWPDAGDVEAFLKAGFTKAQVMEVILGLAVKLMTNYANHLADTPLDAPLKQFALKD